MGAGTAGDFGNTKGSRDNIKAALKTLGTIIDVADTINDLRSLPEDIKEKDWVSVGLDTLGIMPLVGKIVDSAKIADNAVNAIKATNKAANKAADIEKLSKEASTIAKRSPIRIPKKAQTQVQVKDGYSQIKYKWESGKYKYMSRWHTRMPNAPKNQGTSWVVERRLPGVGYGKNAGKPKEEILVGKNKWISSTEWGNAIKARRNGTATKKQKEWLDNGHWKD